MRIALGNTEGAEGLGRWGGNVLGPGNCLSLAFGVQSGQGPRDGDTRASESVWATVRSRGTAGPALLQFAGRQDKRGGKRGAGQGRGEEGEGEGRAPREGGFLQLPDNNLTS